MNNKQLGHKKLTKDDVSNRLSGRGIVLSGEYVKYHTKTTFQCSKGHTWSATPANVLYATGCPHCSGNTPLTKQIVNERIADRGLVMLGEYLHQHKKVLFKCKEGHTWEGTPSSVLYANDCPKCGRIKAANKKRLSSDTIRERLASREIELIGEYSHANAKTMFRCGDGHTWKTTPSSVMSGTGCPHCISQIRLTKKLVKERTIAEQSSKRIIIIQDKEYDSLESAARAFGKSRNTVDYRLSKGWTPEQAVGLVHPPSFAARTPGAPIQVEGRVFKTIKEAAKHHNRAYAHVIEMLKKGRSTEQAFGLSRRPDTLQSENPVLAKQWHPYKNIPLVINDVSRGSGKKVWWLCSNNHEWEATINSRNRGHDCPYCAGQKSTSDRNFATEYPELLKELDLIKNKNLDPKKLSPRTQQKVWWKCEKGHSWEATITNRTRKRTGTRLNNSCPYCNNRKLGNDNSLAQLRPDIAKDWHPTKNGALTPNDVVAGGGSKVWWICKHGHEWQCIVGTRVHNSAGCPKCALQTSRIEIAVYSEIMSLFSNVSWQEKIEGYECDIFIEDKNIGIEIDGVYWHRRRSDVDRVKSKLFAEKGILLFRLREHGLPLTSERDISFKWSDNVFPIISSIVKQILQFAKISEDERLKLQSYVDGNSLINEKLYRKIVSNLPAPPPGRSLADKNPALAKEWAYDLNAPLTPEHFRPSANKSAWWRCKQGHTWKAVIQQRTFHRSGCLRCTLQTATSENSLAATHPELAKEWHPEKNGSIRPEEIYPKSNQKFWWKCGEGHEWQAVVGSRVRGCGCPYCYGRFASETNNLEILFPKVLTEWDYELNKGINPSDCTPYVGKKVWWICTKGHSWQATINNRTRNKSGCPHCARNNSRKYSIKYFQEFAIQRGGKCLSTEYLQCKTKIKMICKSGHEFETRADNIIYEQKWCSRCSKDQ